MNFVFFSLIANAFLLGLKHGIDWDHLAAIMDIVGASTSSGGDGGGTQKESIALSLFYVIGHALVVLLLGIAALVFAASLPRWIDPFMERAVGFTLVILGLWVFYALSRSFSGKGDFKLVSRWMAVLAWGVTVMNWLRAGLSSDKTVKQMKIKQYGPKTAFGVGMIHGLGAETGTQVLLLTLVGGSNSHLSALGMLIAFIVGMMLSNILVAVFSSMGLVSTAKMRATYLTVGILVGFFSLVIGSYFIVGQANLLPDLQRFFRS